MRDCAHGLWKALPDFGAAEERDADEAAQVELARALGPELAFVDAAVFWVEDGAFDPVVTVGMEVAEEDEAEDGLIFVFAGAFGAGVVFGAFGIAFEDASEELAVDEVGFHLALGRAVAFGGLPAADGALELGGKLLGLRGSDERDEGEGEVTGDAREVQAATPAVGFRATDRLGQTRLYPW